MDNGRQVMQHKLQTVCQPGILVVVGRKVALTTDQCGRGIGVSTFHPVPEFNQLSSLFVGQLILAI